MSGACLRARKRRAAPRYQTGKRAHRPQRARQTGRFWHGVPHERRGLGRSARRNHRIHVARTARRVCSGRALRPVLPCLRALRVALRRQALCRRVSRRLAQAHRSWCRDAQRAFARYSRIRGARAFAGALPHAGIPTRSRGRLCRDVPIGDGQCASGQKEPRTHDRAHDVRRDGPRGADPRRRAHRNRSGKRPFGNQIPSSPIAAGRHRVGPRRRLAVFCHPARHGPGSGSCRPLRHRHRGRWRRRASDWLGPACSRALHHDCQLDPPRPRTALPCAHRRIGNIVVARMGTRLAPCINGTRRDLCLIRIAIAAGRCLSCRGLPGRIPRIACRGGNLVRARHDLREAVASRLHSRRSPWSRYAGPRTSRCVLYRPCPHLRCGGGGALIFA